MVADYRTSIKQSIVLCLCSAIAGAAICAGLFSIRPSPAGAQGAAHAEPGDAKVSCPVIHFDIGCKDIARTREFYSKLFDWKIRQEGPAGFIDTGSKEGIQGHITSLGHEPEHYVTFYVQVNDIKAYLERARRLGGKTLVPAITIPTGQFAWISDPDGNIVGLLQPKAKPPGGN